MILLAWALIRYLKTPRHGFTNEELNEAETLKGMQIAESLVIAQTFKEAPQQPDQFEFGGGSTEGRRRRRVFLAPLIEQAAGNE